MTISYSSFAKINLSLSIFKPLDNGYHPIQSIFQEIDLSDTLTVTYTPTTSTAKLALSSAGISMPCDNSNSISSVFNAFQDRLTHDYSVQLHKNIPLGSGMGGASSNAATFLKALNQIENWQLSIEALKQESMVFGSDLPFFIQGGTAFVSGIGDHIEPFSSQDDLSFIIIHPFIHCSTPDVYRHFDNICPLKDVPTPILPSLQDCLGTNDLLPAVLDLYPEMQSIYKSLEAIIPIPVFLTGSGSTFFCTLSSKENPSLILETLQDQFPSFLIRHCLPITNNAL